MKASLGVLALALGAVSALLGIVVLLWGIRRDDPRMLRLGRRYAFMILGASVLAVVAMEWALLTHDFSLRYVAENNARGTPLLFTITGLWAALEGSILLWGLILGGYLAYMAYHFRHRAADPVVAWAMVVAFAVALFFFVLMLGPANPFETLASAPADGRGPNPLLQNHPLMAFHPPMLYLGYVGMTVPFSFAIAALITGRLGEGWLTETRRATLVAWGFLTVGIILGAWWSYEVLGWGGYWAWDPVENASLLPWLTATAFIHSVVVQERRGMLRVWNLSLVVATFCLTILGTFLTRSGVLNSVHSFTESPIGGWLLGFLAVVTIGSVGLIAWRGDKLRAPGRIDSPVSRESAFLLNNLLFAGLAVVVLLGTVYPLLAEALQNRQLSVGEPYFDRMTTPIGVALLFLMAIAPALPWRATSGDVLRRRLLVPAWFGVAVMVIAAVLGVRSFWTLVTFGVAAFAVGGIVRQFALGFRAQHAAGAAWWQTPVRTVRGGPRPVRRPHRAPRHRVHRGGARRVERVHDQGRGPPGQGRVRDGVGLHVHVRGSRRDVDAAEAHRQGPDPHRAGRARPRYLRAVGVDVPRRHERDRDAVGQDGPAARRLPHPRLRADRPGPGDHRHRDQPDGGVDLDRRLAPRLRHRRRAPAQEPAGGRAARARGRPSRGRRR